MRSCPQGGMGQLLGGIGTHSPGQRVLLNGFWRRADGDDQGTEQKGQNGMQTQHQNGTDHDGHSDEKNYQRMHGGILCRQDEQRQ